MNSVGDGPCKIGVGGCAGQLSMEKVPVYGPEGDLVSDGTVAQHGKRVVNQPPTSRPGHSRRRNP